MFNFVKKNLRKVYHQFTNTISAFCSRNTIDDATLKELEVLFTEADTGVQTTKYIIEHLQKNQQNNGYTFKEKLSNILIKILTIEQPLHKQTSILWLELTENEQYDSLIVDTAGRLQTNRNLMRELEKIKRVLSQQLPNHTITTLLTVDAMLGQNSLEQVRFFHEAITLDGIALTKMDETGKGGIVFAIAHQLKIPISYISFGEQPTDYKKFNAHDYVQELLK